MLLTFFILGAILGYLFGYLYGWHKALDNKEVFEAKPIDKIWK